MRTSFIYIILLFFGILLIIPGILLRSNDVASSGTYGVEYNLGWDRKITVPVHDSQKKAIENQEYYDEDQELEKWMTEPGTWNVIKDEKVKSTQKVSPEELVQVFSNGINFEIIVKI